MITCVHIIQLKVLTSIRVGNKQKKVDIAIPKLDAFIHKVYIHVARKVYSNVYLFEKNIPPLAVQKHMRELEVIIQECILTAIRESIPTEDIIKAYMDESVEHEEEIVIENMDEPVLPSNEEEEKDKDKESFFQDKMSEDERPPVVPSIQDLDDKPVLTRLKFNDFDSIMDDEGQVSDISAPKNIERLEEISTERAIQRKLEEDEELDDAIKIHTDTIPLEGLVDLDKPEGLDNDFVSLDDIEELN